MLKFIAILLIEILAGVEVDLFIPSFPELQKVFELSPFMVQLTLSVNLLRIVFAVFSQARLASGIIDVTLCWEVF